MKTSRMLRLILLLLPLLSSAVTAVVLYGSLKPMQQAENTSVSQVIENVRKKYPQVTEEELIASLSAAASDGEGEALLRRYGIRDGVWAVEENEQNVWLPVGVGAAVCLLSGWSVCGLFWMFTKRYQKRTQQLTEYFVALNRGEYVLKPQGNSEDEDSRLQNEIYKTTVALREQSLVARKAKEELKTAISDISHQLKTPLTSMGIMLDSLLEEEEMPLDLQQDFLREIRFSADHLGFLVQALLKLSKLDADSVDFHKEEEPLRDLLYGCIRSTEVMAELKGVTLLCDCPPECLLYCDKKWMEEALTNIVKNCIEHTEAGGTVRLSAVQNHAYTQIDISDTGCGIDPDELPHIFERFYKTRHSGENSVGIGLSLTKAIVEKQNGRVKADSVPGEGTTFTIRFPRL